GVAGRLKTCSKVCTPPPPGWRPSSSSSTPSPTTWRTSTRPATSRRSSASTTCSTPTAATARTCPPAQAPRPRWSVATRPRTRSLVTVPAPDGLVADGDSVFSATAASGAIRTAKNATLQQGALEGSNVNLGEEMAKMMSAQQQYAMGSQAIQYQAQMLSIANQ